MSGESTEFRHSARKLLFSMALPESSVGLQLPMFHEQIRTRKSLKVQYSFSRFSSEDSADRPR